MIPSWQRGFKADFSLTSSGIGVPADNFSHIEIAPASGFLACVAIAKSS
jgi:hypothetical protein